MLDYLTSLSRMLRPSRKDASCPPGKTNEALDYLRNQDVLSRVLPLLTPRDWARLACTVKPLNVVLAPPASRNLLHTACCEAAHMPRSTALRTAAARHQLCSDGFSKMLALSRNKLDFCPQKFYGVSWDDSARYIRTHFYAAGEFGERSFDIYDTQQQEFVAWYTEQRPDAHWAARNWVGPTAPSTAQGQQTADQSAHVALPHSSRCTAISTDGQHVVHVSEDGLTFMGLHPEPITRAQWSGHYDHVAWSPDNTRVAVSGSSGWSVLNTRTMQLRTHKPALAKTSVFASLFAPVAPKTSLQWFPDSHHFLVCFGKHMHMVHGDDGTPCWNIARPSCFAISPAGTGVATPDYVYESKPGTCTAMAI